MRGAWKTSAAYDVLKRQAEDEARKAHPAPRCPNCGAPGIYGLIDASTGAGPYFVPGLCDCSARCYETDPDGYLKAVNK